MIENKKLVLFNKQPQKSTKQKTGKDAARYRKLFEWFEQGVATLVIAGQTLSAKEINTLPDILDDQIEKEVKEQRRLKESYRRKRLKKSK